MKRKTILDEIIEIMEEHGGMISNTKLYEDYAERHPEKKMNESKKGTLRKLIHFASSDSKSFDRGEDIFYNVEGMGKGVWGLRKYMK